MARKGKVKREKKGAKMAVRKKANRARKISPLKYKGRKPSNKSKNSKVKKLICLAKQRHKRRKRK